MESSGNGQQRYWNTFLYSVKASIFKGFQREATFYYPNWWASIPMPIASFLEEYDFSGKTIIPFATHGGYGVGSSVEDIKKLCPDAKVIEDIFEADREDIGKQIKDTGGWIKGLGISK